MCIRDRIDIVREKTGRQHILFIIDEVGQYVGSRPNLILNLCLLYTSDAADERSSVDLGGRRIIKKKKKTDMNGSGSIQTNNTTADN